MQRRTKDSATREAQNKTNQNLKIRRRLRQRKRQGGRGGINSNPSKKLKK